MIIKKNYADDDYIIIDVTKEYTLNNLIVVGGKCIDIVDPDGAMYEKGDYVEVFMSDLVEVIEA